VTTVEEAGERHAFGQACEHFGEVIVDDVRAVVEIDRADRLVESVGLFANRLYGRRPGGAR
jgi:hypothetical protein